MVVPLVCEKLGLPKDFVIKVYVAVRVKVLRCRVEVFRDRWFNGLGPRL